jgi:hypothetical protein
MVLKGGYSVNGIIKYVQSLMIIGSLMGIALLPAYSGSFDLGAWGLAEEEETADLEDDTHRSVHEQEYGSGTSLPDDLQDGAAFWEKTFGGSSSDIGRCVQQTDDGGYIVTGWTTSFGAGPNDVYLIKTDASGNEQWSRALGGSGDDRGYSVQQTNDGGYIITGHTDSYGAGGNNVYLIKTDASGIEEWSNTFGESGWDYGRSVQQTEDGGYIIAGSTGGDVSLIKTDASGIEEWSSSYEEGYGNSVQQTEDGGYIIAGFTRAVGITNTEIYLVKTDASGVEEWSRTWGNPNEDEGLSVQETKDGGYIVTGYLNTSPDPGFYDVPLIKTDAHGVLEWGKKFDRSEYDGGYSVQQTDDGGFIVAGYTEIKYPNFDVYLIKTDSSGVEEWSQTLGGSEYEEGNSLQQTNDGGYIIVGHTKSFGAGSDDVYLIYFKPDTHDISVSLVPDATMVPRGGTLGYWVTVTNNTASVQCFDYWTNVTLPNSNKYPPMGELFGPHYLCLDPYDSRSAHLSHAIPLTAPLGDYLYNGFVGPYPDITNEYHFYFTVTTATAGRGPSE